MGPNRWPAKNLEILLNEKPLLEKKNIWFKIGLGARKNASMQYQNFFRNTFSIKAQKIY